uniref:Uncharacterized protein n=1 Tax=Glossina pallidipes TaxID=7398 RepID=A0A1B0AHT0_GLOPL
MAIKRTLFSSPIINFNKRFVKLVFGNSRRIHKLAFITTACSFNTIAFGSMVQYPKRGEFICKNSQKKTSGLLNSLHFLTKFTSRELLILYKVKKISRSPYNNALNVYAFLKALEQGIHN